MAWLSPLNQRRLRNFKANRRAVWSLWVFSILFGLSLCAEIIANDKPILVKYQDGYYTPFRSFYPETTLVATSGPRRSTVMLKFNASLSRAV